MRKALEGTPVESFAPAQIPVTGKAVLDGKLESQTVVVDKASGKLATEYTPASMREERQYAQYHEILHYVDPNEPRGAAPEHPENHPQYAAWEAGVAAWLLRRETETGIKITQGAAPTEYDDVHVPANAPRVRLTSPANGAQFADRSLSASAEADAPRGVRRVDFYLDGLFLGSDSLFPYVLSTRIPASVSRGYHTLKAVAYDDVENAGSDSIGITVDSDPSASGFEILDPKNGQTIERSSDSYTVVVSLGRPSDYRSVTLFAQPSGTGDRQVIGGKLNPDSPFLTFVWGLPLEGEWILQAEGELLTGERVSAAGAVVHIVKPSETASPPPPAGGEGGPEPAPIPLLPLDPFAAATTQPAH
jgi:hypothetical protein